MAWFPRELTDGVTCCTQYSRVSEFWNQNYSTQWHDTSNISTTPRVRTEADDAFQKMLDPVAGSAATGKSMATIIHLFFETIFSEQVVGI